MKKLVIYVLPAVLLIAGGCIAVIYMNASLNISKIPDTCKYTFGSSFPMDNYELSVGEDFEYDLYFTTYHKMNILSIPIEITKINNTSDVLSYSVFAPDGRKLKKVNIDERISETSIDFILKNLDQGVKTNSHIYFLCYESGTYYSKIKDEHSIVYLEIPFIY